MLGRKYRLDRALRAVYSNDGEKGFVLIPEGAILTIDGHHDAERILQVSWRKRTLLVFAEDLRERGIEMRVASASAQSKEN